jgi:hypothetical protein
LLVALLRELHRAWAFFRIEIKRGAIRETITKARKDENTKEETAFFMSLALCLAGDCIL